MENRVVGGLDIGVRLVDDDGGACAGVEVIVAEGFLETCEGWFAGAVARGDALDIPLGF